MSSDHTVDVSLLQSQVSTSLQSELYQQPSCAWWSTRQHLNDPHKLFSCLIRIVCVWFSALLVLMCFSSWQQSNNVFMVPNLLFGISASEYMQGLISLNKHVKKLLYVLFFISSRIYVTHHHCLISENFFKNWVLTSKSQRPSTGMDFKKQEKLKKLCLLWLQYFVDIHSWVFGNFNLI